MTTLAPIVLFVYARLYHTRETIEALLKNDLAKDSNLIIYSDAPRDSSKLQFVNEVREYLSTVKGFQTLTIHERSTNLGLAQSIIQGVTETLLSFERVIVLEDDLVVSPHFLTYMNAALDMYADDAQVASIHAYQYPVKKTLPETFFLRGSDCWGWATWRRAWQCFNPDGQALLTNLEAQRLTSAFDLDGACGFTQMLKDQINHKNDSWAIRWHASCYLANMFTLYPSKSFVDNIGMDGTGEHCSPSNLYANTLSNFYFSFQKIAIAENNYARKIIADYLRPSLTRRVKNFIRQQYEKLRHTFR